MGACKAILVGLGQGELSEVRLDQVLYMYKGTSPIRKRDLVGPCSGTTLRLLWCS